MKKLREPETAIENFFSHIKALGKKAGPILFQLPPRWHRNPERLAAFLKALPKTHRYAFEFSLIFIDLDHFKNVNDTYGHLMGSKLLAEIGTAIKDKCRLIDLAFRYGGDEFVLLLPQTSKENAIGVASRLHKLIRETVWLKEAGLNVHITASVGVASYPSDSRTKAELLHLADEAMYLVKNTSRDNVAAAGVGVLSHE